MKRLLGVRRALPEIYELVRTISSIQAVHTFNYDAFLRRSAEREGSEHHAYPFAGWDSKGARFVYLHGSVEGASGIEDLALCEEDYLIAYDESSDLVALLRHYYKRLPVVFAGTSLSDDSFLRAISDIANRVQNQPAGNKELLVTDPRWYVFLPKDTASNMTVMNSKMRTYSVRPIWYESEREDHGALLQALNMIKAELRPQVNAVYDSPESVLRAREARRLAALSSPTASQRRLARDLLADRKAKEAFFAIVDSPVWFEALKSAGALEPDEPTALQRWRTRSTRKEMTFARKNKSQSNRPFKGRSTPRPLGTQLQPRLFSPALGFRGESDSLFLARSSCRREPTPFSGSAGDPKTAASPRCVWHDLVMVFEVSPALRASSESRYR